MSEVIELPTQDDCLELQTLDIERKKYSTLDDLISIIFDGNGTLAYTVATLIMSAAPDTDKIPSIVWETTKKLYSQDQFDPKIEEQRAMFSQLIILQILENRITTIKNIKNPTEKAKVLKNPATFTEEDLEAIQISLCSENLSKNLKRNFPEITCRKSA